MPTTLPNSFIQESSIQVRLVVVMQEVSIDPPQQQLRPFSGKVRQVRIFLQGVTPPPNEKFLQINPLEALPLLNLPLSPSSVCAQFSSSSWIFYLGPLPPLGGGGGLLHITRPPPPLLLLLPPIPLIPLPLAPWLCSAFYLGLVAEVWPLCGPPPSGKFTMLSTILLACSYGAPLPPAGGCEPSTTLCNI